MAPDNGDHVGRMMSAEDWLAEAEAHPWSVVADALLYEAEGKPLPVEVADAAYMAGTLLAASALVRAGMSMETLDYKFGQQEYSVHFTYHRDSDEFGVTIDWEDGSSTDAKQSEVDDA